MWGVSVIYRVPTLLISALFTLACALQAQSNPSAMHQMSVSSTTIDGAVHPEQIPDSTAYRLYLIATSEPASPTTEQVRRQNARLNKVGLNDKDRQTVASVLATFNLKYHDWINRYNEVASAAWAQHQSFDKTSLLLERDNLVQATRDELQSKLSTDGWTRFDAHVKSEKKHMRISVPEAKP